jgi:hypothetical protein
VVKRSRGGTHAADQPTKATHAAYEGTSWVSSVSIAPKARVRNDAGEVGCSFTATETVSVLSLCRLPTPGSDNVFPVMVVHTNGTTVAKAGVDARSKPDKNGYVCNAVDGDSGTAMLVKGEAYALVEDSTSCDSHYDDTGAKLQVVGGSAANVRSIYGSPPHVTPGGGGADHCYGPLNFYYTQSL